VRKFNRKNLLFNYAHPIKHRATSFLRCVQIISPVVKYEQKKDTSCTCRTYLSNESADELHLYQVGPTSRYCTSRLCLDLQFLPAGAKGSYSYSGTRTMLVDVTTVINY
jgi:hypothetical protein